MPTSEKLAVTIPINRLTRTKVMITANTMRYNGPIILKYSEKHYNLPLSLLFKHYILLKYLYINIYILFTFTYIYIYVY